MWHNFSKLFFPSGSARFLLKCDWGISLDFRWTFNLDILAAQIIIFYLKLFLFHQSVSKAWKIPNQDQIQAELELSLKKHTRLKPNFFSFSSIHAFVFETLLAKRRQSDGRLSSSFLALFMSYKSSNVAGLGCYFKPEWKKRRRKRSVFVFSSNDLFTVWQWWMTAALHKINEAYP